MGGNLKVWVLKFRGKIFGGNIMVYISSGETNTVYLNWSVKKYEGVLLSILDGSSNGVEIRGLLRLER